MASGCFRLCLEASVVIARRSRLFFSYQVQAVCFHKWRERIFQLQLSLCLLWHKQTPSATSYAVSITRECQASKMIMRTHIIVA